MRQIKFRGKRIDEKGWVYGLLIINKVGYFIVDDYNPHYCNEYGYIEIDLPKQVIPETIGQFTGLCDKNGKEIYESDIITDNIGNDCIIKWNQDDCSFSMDYYSHDLLEPLYVDYQKSIKITGNIHEN